MTLLYSDWLSCFPALEWQLRQFGNCITHHLRDIRARGSSSLQKFSDLEEWVCVMGSFLAMQRA